MNIGIVVYSHTGHTHAVVDQLQDALTAAGHAVTLATLETVQPLQMSDTTAELKALPDVDPYDGLVFACPVRGGTPAPPMRVYLEQIPSLAGKPVVCVVTGVMPASWGRIQTLAQMRALCEAKGARVLATGSIWWPSPRRGQRIAGVVDEVRAAF